MSSFRLYNTGLSNSFLIVLIQGGLYLSIIYLGTMALMVFKSYKLKNNLYFSIGILQIFVIFYYSFSIYAIYDAFNSI